MDTGVAGPWVRQVRHVAFFTDCVVGTSETDPNSLPHPGYKYQDVLEQLPKRLRIAYSADLGYVNIEPDVRRECAKGVKAFEEMGHDVDYIDHVIDDLRGAWGQLGATAGYAKIYEKLETEDRERFGRSYLEGIMTAERVDWPKYGRLHRARAKLNNQPAEFFGKYDLRLPPPLPFHAIDARGGWPPGVGGQPPPPPFAPAPCLLHFPPCGATRLRTSCTASNVSTVSPD